MNHDHYLGELAMELRLRLPDDVAADAVAEIASHLDSTSADPVAELGEPHELAAELVAGYGSSKALLVRNLLLSILSFFALLIAMTLLFDGNIDSSSFSTALMQAVMIGGVVNVVRGRARASFRNGEFTVQLGLVAVAVLTALVVGLVTWRLDFVIEVPVPLLVAVALLVFALSTMWLLYRPLPFEKNSGLKSNILTGKVGQRKA